MDKSSVIFGNPIDRKTLRQAEAAKRKYLRKYGDDSGKDYRMGMEPIPALADLCALKMVFAETTAPLPEKPLIVGNIRMGFGHYRISIAMASCARALGYTPLWLDLAGFDATGSKMIREQNDLYSLASRISQKSRLFNHFVWEPLNCEGFRALTYNAKDQKNSELLVPLFRNIPGETPYIATHAWPAQAAVHAGMTHVVNAIPDNWPMALHLSEGAIHAVQTPFAYMGYKMLNGFADHPLKGIPEDRLKMVGRYVDHELLVDLEADNAARKDRSRQKRPMRILLTVGGAGAGYDMFLAIVRHLLPLVQAKRAALFINFGDHRDLYEKMTQRITIDGIKTCFNDFEGLKKLAEDLKTRDAEGILAICNEDIFSAVYSTNLLMPRCDILVTKPSELAYYPIPKVFMKHIGGHEVYGAVNAAELGDASFECPTEKTVTEMIDRLLDDSELYCHMADRITQCRQQGYYDGGYACVRLAAGQGDGIRVE